MNVQLAVTCLLVMTALASYINHRFLKFPSSVGITLITLMIAAIIIILNRAPIPYEHLYNPIISLVDMNVLFMSPEFFISVVCFLLFAGGLHICAIELAKQKMLIAALATFGVITSTAIIGSLIWVASHWLGIHLSFAYCLVFGALISPTDPIAVLGMLKKVRAPQSLSMRITGESLYNDGVGIVFFITLLHIAKGNSIEHETIMWMLLREIIGGVGLGCLLGMITNGFLRHVKEFHVSLLISLASVMTGYALAIHWHASAPIALATSGLVVGYKLKQGGLSLVTAKELQAFGEMIDEVLNAILFVVIGLVVLQLSVSQEALLLAGLAIPIVLFARFASVSIPITLFSHVYQYSPYVIRIMTWGGFAVGIDCACAFIACRHRKAAYSHSDLCCGTVLYFDSRHDNSSAYCQEYAKSCFAESEGA